MAIWLINLPNIQGVSFMKIRHHEYLFHVPGNARKNAQESGDAPLPLWNALKDLLPFKRRGLIEERLRKAVINQLRASDEYDSMSRQRKLANYTKLGTATELPNLSMEKSVIEMKMGQGVVGNLKQVTLYSEDFSSCTPVIFYNQCTKIGGLYHFPAEMLSNRAQSELSPEHNIVKATLKSMLEEVKPTEIILNTRNPYIYTPTPHGWQPDSFHLENFFRDQQGCSFNGEIKKIEGPGFGAISVDLDKLEQLAIKCEYRTDFNYTIALDSSAEETADLLRTMADAPSMTKFGRNMNFV